MSNSTNLIIKSSGASFPKGPKDPNDPVLGPKCNNINGMWALKPYYLGPIYPLYNPHISLYIPL